MTVLHGGLFLIDFVLSQICLFEMGSFSVNYTLDLGLLVLVLCLCMLFSSLLWFCPLGVTVWLPEEYFNLVHLFSF